MRPGSLVALLLVAAACGVLFAPAPASSQEPPPFPQLWMPWEGGSVWRYSYGPHSGSAPVDDALDFQPLDSAGRQCETFTSAHWAVAAADGRAVVLQNAVEVDHGGGFRTGYFHLADKQVSTGDEVKAGQRLGRPGCCPDGGSSDSCWSTDPHLHFYTVFNGVRRPIGGTSIGGWAVGTDGCLEKADVRACPGASIMSNTPRHEGPAPPPPLAVTVAFDVSGSMRGVAQAGDLMRIVSPYLDTSSTGGGVTLLAFNSHARVLARPGERRPLEELTASVSGMEPEGNTDLNAGLAMACREMQARESGSRQALVLITDGVHNGARLHEPHRCFAKHGWPVFSYGVGRANAPFLERLAAATGGEFRPVAAVFDPVCEMERLRTLLSGGARGLCSRYLLRPGENLSVPLTVPPEQSQLALAVTWTVLGKMDGEQSIKTTVRLPGGSMLNAEAALSHEEDTGSERYAVASPAPGIWEAVLSGHGLPSAGALLSVSFGTTPVTRPAAPAATETPAPEEQGGEASPEETPDDTITPTPGATEEPETSPTPAPTRRPRRTPAPTATASPQTPTPSPLPSP